jgi:starch synthase
VRERFDLRSTGVKVSVPIQVKDDTIIKVGEVFETEANGLRAFFIRNDEYYDREYLYGTPKGDYEDNAPRFVFYSRGVVEFLRAGAFAPQIVHCHDWQAALIPLYIKTLYKDDPAIGRLKTLLTIHNLGYQGIFWKYDLKQIGLDESYFTPEYLEFYGNINFLKGGIIFADRLNTVSKKYAREIQTPQFGCRLEGILLTRTNDLHGIVNGLDYKVWNPEQDKNLAANFSAKDLSGKKVCKDALKKEFGLEPGNQPLIGNIGRLAYQKGLDLVADSIAEIIGMGYQLVILGTGEEKYEKLLKERANQFPGKFALKVAFNDALAHRIEAGADLFLMPSRYEPCGLNQLISLKYGTVPVVTATGGLDDTIEDFNPQTQKGTGFKMKEPSKTELLASLKRAIDVYNQPALWEKLVKNGMKKDFSWKSSAKEYLELYKSLLK